MVKKSLFSSDRWLHGQTLVDLAPMVVGEVQLSMDQDRHLWKHEASGSFSSKLAYSPSSMVRLPW
jgi:hypothetical protein